MYSMHIRQFLLCISKYSVKVFFGIFQIDVFERLQINILMLQINLADLFELQTLTVDESTIYM
jgi:hypothetical protein